LRTVHSGIFAGRFVVTLRELVETQSNKNPDKVFLYFDKQEVTYREFDENINKAANLFLDLGIEKGDRVCFFLPNCPEYLYGWLGLAKIGAILVPINTNYKTEETRYILHHSQANTLLVHVSLKEVVEKVRSDMPFLKNLLSLGGKKADGYLPFEDALWNSSSHLRPTDVGEHDLCEIMYTSGTTGPSKGVMITHQYWIINGYGYSYPMDVRPEDRLFTCLPLFHANAQGYSTMGALTAGASLILMERFSATRFWDEIRHYKATVFNFIGAMLTILSKQPQSERDRDHRVRAAYGSPALDKDFQEYMEQRFGITFVSGYGLTECGLCIIQPLHGLRKEGSLGLPKQIPGFGFVNEIKVVDEKDQEVPRRTIGEIVIKNPAVTKGYYRDPALTNKVIRDGWLHTGDRAWMDEDGYFFFADRKKDVIRRRGENVSSLEVENVINTHPKVLESAIIGVPSEFQDDEVKAFIVLKPNESLDPLDLIKWCTERLAYFKIPRFIEIRSEFPRTPTLRVQKYKLREEGKSKDCFDLMKTDFKLR
jgi:crotonobetaine/carnitine-CoA ligase